MFNKLAVFLYLTAVVSASQNNNRVVSTSTVSSLHVSSSPPPLLVSPTPTPEIISYSVSPIAANTERVESYKTVTVHPPPAKYKTSSVTAHAAQHSAQYNVASPFIAAPFLAKNIPTSAVSSVPQYVIASPVTPNYVQNIQQYPTPITAQYAAVPTPVKYLTPVVIRTVNTAPVVKYSKAPSLKIVGSPAVSYGTNRYVSTPVVQKYISAPLVTKTQSYDSLYLMPVQPIPVPFEYPVRYFSAPMVYPKQGHVMPTYSKARTYSPATSVSRVSFNGLGTSYGY